MNGWHWEEKGGKGKGKKKNCLMNFFFTNILGVKKITTLTNYFEIVNY